MTGRLASGQRAIARLLRAPEGVRAALAEAGDPEGRSLESRVRGDATASAVQRLEIYANATFHRMREALEQEFDALARALGDTGFHDLVASYLLVHPSRRPSLRHVGEALPEFLAGHGVAEPFRRRWPWAADLARLEWALSLAFDAPEARRWAAFPGGLAGDRAGGSASPPAGRSAGRSAAAARPVRVTCIVEVTGQLALRSCATTDQGQVATTLLAVRGLNAMYERAADRR